MREATNGKKPRYAIWENVCGAFSSNGGEDFNTVLDAFVSCVEDGVQVPAPKTGIWPKADLLLGDGWSVAYRTFDAQYWGVPQRRTRIYLVADFNGESAGKVLFESEGVSRDSSARSLPWKRTAGSSESRVGDAVIIENHPTDSRVKLSEDGKVQTLTERMGTGGGNVPMVAEPAYGISKEAYDSGKNANFEFSVMEEKSPTIMARAPCAVAKPDTYDIRFTSERTKNVRGHVYQTDIARCLDSGGPDTDSNHGGIAVMAFDADYKDPAIVNEHGYIVRRLTPTECARLQGFPDEWCMDLAVPDPSDDELEFWADVWNTWDDINGKKHKTETQIRKWLANPYSDAEEYRLWGNGVALPCPFHVLKGIADEN